VTHGSAPAVILAFPVIVALLLPTPARVATIPVAKLAEDSDLIVIARVTSVTGRWFARRTARATPIASWKGHPEEVVEFLASPTWTCDVSTAVPGETAVLFLRVDDTGRLTIGHSGRGRMPIVTVDEQAFATSYGDLTFPAGALQGVPGREQGPYSRGVDLGRLGEIVKGALEEARGRPAGGGCR
jgi:hypothetical protein